VRRLPSSEAVIVALIALVGLVLTGCGSGAPSTDRGSASPSTSPPARPHPSARLRSVLLTTAQLPSGWTRDTAPDALSTKGTPACLTALLEVHGSTTRAETAFLSSSGTPAVVESVGQFATPASAAASVGSLHADLQSCDDQTVSSGPYRGTLTVAALGWPVGGGLGFDAQVTVAADQQRAYLDVEYAVRGSFGMFYGWESPSPDLPEAQQLASTAAARL